MFITTTFFIPVGTDLSEVSRVGSLCRVSGDSLPCHFIYHVFLWPLPWPKLYRVSCLLSTVAAIFTVCPRGAEHGRGSLPCSMPRGHTTDIVAMAALSVV
jgi:hypothetical protein